MFEGDPIGYAIHDYLKNKADQSIIVKSDLSEDDVLPVPYLFRSFDEMPPIEQVALQRAEGKVLDVGAGAGPHAKWLKNEKFEVVALDTSKKAVDYLNSLGIKAFRKDINDFNDGSFDTLLLLMNGIGIAGKIDRLTDFLTHCSSLLNSNGRILCDSTDVRYFFEDDEGAVWMDLNTEYYGQFKFQMSYKEVETSWFDWLYLDIETLKTHCEEAGLNMEIVHEDGAAFLAEITKKQ